MKKTIIFSVLLSMLLGCGAPQTFSVNLEKRQKQQGIDLAGKSISVVCTGAGPEEQAVAVSVGEGFSTALEADYFDGEKGIALFEVDSLLLTRESILSLLVETGSDVLFVFVPTLSEPSQTIVDGKAAKSVPCELRLLAYDSLGEDSVKQYIGKASFVDPAPGPGLSEEGLAASAELGKAAAVRFLSKWQTMQYSFYYRSTFQSAWDEATEAVLKMDWKESVAKWMTLLDAKDAYTRSALEYNIATALHLTGDNKLALKWLEISEKDASLPLQPGLRKRIEAEL